MDPVDAFQRRFRTAAAMRPGVAAALVTAGRVVSRLTADGTVRFRTPFELAAALEQMRFDLVANDPCGPPHEDARQLIYRCVSGLASGAVSP